MTCALSTLQAILLVHFSARYKADAIQAAVAASLPPSLLSRVAVATAAHVKAPEPPQASGLLQHADSTTVSAPAAAAAGGAGGGAGAGAAGQAADAKSTGGGGEG